MRAAAPFISSTMTSSWLISTSALRGSTKTSNQRNKSPSKRHRKIPSNSPGSPLAATNNGNTVTWKQQQHTSSSHNKTNSSSPSSPSILQHQKRHESSSNSLQHHQKTTPSPSHKKSPLNHAAAASLKRMSSVASNGTWSTCLPDDDLSTNHMDDENDSSQEYHSPQSQDQDSTTDNEPAGVPTPPPHLSPDQLKKRHNSNLHKIKLLERRIREKETFFDKPVGEGKWAHPMILSDQDRYFLLDGKFLRYVSQKRRVEIKKKREEKMKSLCEWPEWWKTKPTDVPKECTFQPNIGNDATSPKKKSSNRSSVSPNRTIRRKRTPNRRTPTPSRSSRSRLGRRLKTDDPSSTAAADTPSRAFSPTWDLVHSTGQRNANSRPSTSNGVSGRRKRIGGRKHASPLKTQLPKLHGKKGGKNERSSSPKKRNVSSAASRRRTPLSRGSKRKSKSRQKQRAPLEENFAPEEDATNWVENIDPNAVYSLFLHSPVYPLDPMSIADPDPVQSTSGFVGNGEVRVHDTTPNMNGYTRSPLVTNSPSSAQIEARDIFSNNGDTTLNGGTGAHTGDESNKLLGIGGWDNG